MRVVLPASLFLLAVGCGGRSVDGPDDSVRRGATTSQGSTNPNMDAITACEEPPLNGFFERAMEHDPNAASALSFSLTFSTIGDVYECGHTQTRVLNAASPSSGEIVVTNELGSTSFPFVSGTVAIQLENCVDTDRPSPEECTLNVPPFELFYEHGRVTLSKPFVAQTPVDGEEFWTEFEEDTTLVLHLEHGDSTSSQQFSAPYFSCGGPYCEFRLEE